ncbi:hypothetical protein [Sediminibacterium sp.]|jgi:(2Fe-2S) ferredoxin|uniref:hypothetical protein n=1 Tax=Sediminibacterium sp. TaxID=1917865 RepID=UPI0025E79477|nr:hypothetical protein [Sediminibacterium sp.]MBT9485650.1 hypothetical protein [Sediminibacterium sp.]
MDQDVLEPVLQEILEELKQGDNLTRENTRILIDQGKCIANIKKIFEQNSFSRDSIDKAWIKKIIEENADRIIKSIMDQPREVSHVKRILLFPEHNAAEFYKLFYGRLFKWITILFIACFLYSLGKEYISAYREKEWYREAYEQILKQKDETGRKSKQKLHS